MLKDTVAFLQRLKREVSNLFPATYEQDFLFLVRHIITRFNKTSCIEEHFTQQTFMLRVYRLKHQNKIGKHINPANIHLILKPSLELELPLPGTLQNVFELGLHLDHSSHVLLVLHCLVGCFDDLVVNSDSLGKRVVVRVVETQFFLVVREEQLVLQWALDWLDEIWFDIEAQGLLDGLEGLFVTDPG